MRALSPPLRSQLETSVLAARRAAEAASRAAIGGLGVFAERRPTYLNAEQAPLRNGLRSKWRQLGNDRDLLVSECAYEQWHRLLFARFLAENQLLLHPQFHAPVTLAECEELAAELGEPDAWSVAAQFAAEILPGIFRLDDPCVRLRLAPEGRFALEQILDAIPAETFLADDALGWVYQFWQKEKKAEVNASERKIGGADLGPITQLFTENYMVRFLLENSLGAWWARRHPDSPLVRDFEYLRFEDGKPAAGTFEGWPDGSAEVTVMDPCCGSGHFLVEAFSMLWQMRAEEERLTPIEAQDAVLRDNLFGLELDARCVQIAMFNVALSAWKAGGGWRQLPVPNIACSGIPVKASADEWKALADGDQRLENALVRLHILFREADTLGSLIDPKRATEISDPSGLQKSLEDADWKEVAPVFAQFRDDSQRALGVLGSTASEIARAADLLSQSYVLVITNVPYLTMKSMSPPLAAFCSKRFPRSKGDLATVVLERARDLTRHGGSFALVTTQNWLSLSSYRRLREALLSDQNWNLLARLGVGAFGAISGEVVQPVLTVHSNDKPRSAFLGIDCVSGLRPEGKAACLISEPGIWLSCAQQLANPDARIVFGEAGGAFTLLSRFATAYAGIQSGDYARFGRYFWELPKLLPGWEYQQSTVSVTMPYGGREHIFLWEAGKGAYYRFVCERLGETGVGAWIRGAAAWGHYGIAVREMGDLPVTLYSGELTDNNVAILIPHRASDLPAIWAYCQSTEYARQVRLLDRKMNVTNTTLVKVPFDAERWRQVADEAGPLPEPTSEDPTQWLFRGRPEDSTAPLQVAVGRLVGYRWPEQTELDYAEAVGDTDGIVCLPAVAGDSPAADRLQQLLAAAFGDTWSPAKAQELLEQAGSKKKSLADWLRDEFFKQHCALFGNRPFVWHIWDGQRDGFSALVNYHRLDGKALQKLTFTYLGQDWVERQRAEVRDEVPGAETRLGAALALQRTLEKILEGEPPLDIYVRWKEIHEQPLGWQPDLNDGVRANVRPFVEAGVLRGPFNIHWRKDRGKNPDGTERYNDTHLTLAEKLEARKKIGRP